MEEYQVWMLLAVQSAGVMLFFLAMTFLIWVAFRVSKTINESGGNIVSKILGSIFGIGVVWFGYGSGIFLSVLNQGAAYSLSELKKAGVEISSLADGFISDNGAGNLPEASFTGDPIVMIWWLSILLIILIGIWGPKNSN
tara:strand:- start:353 stop:772 length:420 start_codon:yes stop_codon:yes gene_type:complete